MKQKLIITAVLFGFMALLWVFTSGIFESTSDNYANTNKPDGILPSDEKHFSDQVSSLNKSDDVETGDDEIESQINFVSNSEEGKSETDLSLKNQSF